MPAITGNYDIIGNPAEADCMIGQSYGAQGQNPGAINELLASEIDGFPNDRLPAIVQGEIADAMVLMGTCKTIAHTIRGNPSTGTGGELDSWQVLLQAREYMRENDLHRPVIFAQAYHVGRVAAQAVKLDMNPIIPAGLPKEFDPDSDQVWTQRAAMWIPRELIGMVYLKAKGKL